jgi:5-methylcytosine-specific restriction endonuclease McrA
MATKVCERPLTRGPMVGLPATGTQAGWVRHQRTNTPACTPCRRAHSRSTFDWRQRHPERAIESNRRYRLKADADGSYYARWRRTPRGRAIRAEHKRRRKARLREAQIVPFTADELEARLSMTGGRCWLCGNAGADTVDHVLPISRGGPHILANLRPAHHSCNGRKGATMPTYEKVA